MKTSAALGRHDCISISSNAEQWITEAFCLYQQQGILIQITMLCGTITINPAQICMYSILWSFCDKYAAQNNEWIKECCDFISLCLQNFLFCFSCLFESRNRCIRKPKFSLMQYMSDASITYIGYFNYPVIIRSNCKSPCIKMPTVLPTIHFNPCRVFTMLLHGVNNLHTHRKGIWPAEFRQCLAFDSEDKCF